MSDPKKRVHARVEVDLLCRVRVGARTHEGRLEDLSQGGGCFVGPRGIADVGTPALVTVTAPTAGDVELPADIVWAEKRETDTRYGLQFNVEGEDERVARVLADVLAGPGIGSRKHPRVYHRLEVVLTSAAQLRVHLSSISLGGLAVECDEPLPPETTVSLELYLEGAPEAVSLSATVRNAWPLPTGGHLVGLEFHALAPERKAQIQATIKRMLTTSE